MTMSNKRRHITSTQAHYGISDIGKPTDGLITQLIERRTSKHEVFGLKATNTKPILDLHYGYLNITDDGQRKAPPPKNTVFNYLSPHKNMCS